MIPENRVLIPFERPVHVSEKGANLNCFLSEKGVYFWVMDLGGCAPLIQLHPPGVSLNAKCRLHYILLFLLYNNKDFTSS